MYDVTMYSRGGRSWVWPKYDNQLIRVFDYVTDLDEILAHVAGREVCVQAGGACGVWPAYLADHFDHVHTFEPDEVNFHCLTYNCRPQSGQMSFYRNALHRDCRSVGLSLHDKEKDNCGAIYLDEQGEGIETMAIDQLNLEACDLIQLDVEGFEMEALQGAAATIERFSPVVAIEEKALPQFRWRERMARTHLETIGYREVGRVHRDVIFKRC